MEIAEQLNTNGNAENTNSKKSNLTELITHIDETPFAVIESEQGFSVVMGKYRMSEAFKTKEEATENAKKITWMRILQVMGATMENYNEK